MTIDKIMLIDDHPLMRQGIKYQLEQDNECRVVAEAGNGVDALILAHEVSPSLIVLNLNMKGMSGLETFNALRSSGSTAKIVVLTASANPAHIESLINAGVDGYLLKDIEPQELVDQLKRAIAGHKVYSREVLQYLHHHEAQQDRFATLTERENQILREVACGYRNKQIADRLFISESTVKVHMKSLLKKLNVPSRTAATVRYIERYGHQFSTPSASL